MARHAPAGIASGASNAIRELGGVFGIAVLGVAAPVAQPELELAS